MAKKIEVSFSAKAVLTALKGQFPGLKSLKNEKLVVYSEWKDSTFTRGRAFFNNGQGESQSFFLHIGPEQLKVWGPKPDIEAPHCIIEGNYI